ncbi:PAS domain-containing protein [Methanosarcina horonobensis]|uniref:PAS domain-containing protein n=1 Tax=Methanosarcina horonobensis TaxID=418008 RepID=UPI000B0B16B6
MLRRKKHTQEKLQESEERFRIAAEQTGQIVFEHDHGDKNIKWAGAIQDVTGYTIEEFSKFDNAALADHIHLKIGKGHLMNSGCVRKKKINSVPNTDSERKMGAISIWKTAVFI